MFQKKNKEIKVEKEKKQESGLTEKKRKKKIIKRVILGVVAVCVIAAIVVSNITAKNAGIPVSVTEAAKGDINATIETSGTVKSEIQKTYFSGASTNVNELNVVVGDIVKEKDQLLTYDVEDLEANSKQVILQGESSSFDYQGRATDNADSVNLL